MANYTNLLRYRLEAGSSTDRSLKHNFFPVTESEIKNAETRLGFSLPAELLEFYKKVGYGFFHNSDEFAQYQLLDPETIADITNREDFHENDPDLEIYDDPDKIIFFKLNEGLYLTMDKNRMVGTSKIYYFSKVIAESLEEFSIKFDENPKYFED